MSRHSAISDAIRAPRNFRLAALVLVFIAINQVDDALVDATVAQELSYWLVRLSVLIGGLWAADSVVARLPADRLAKPDWLRPVIIVSAIGLLPFALAEVVIEPLLPIRPEYVDDDLRAYSMLLVYFGEYITILSILLPVHLVLWLILERKSAGGSAPEDAEPLPMPTFLERTAASSADAVLALQADEHYVRVFTASDTALIHYRFGDAVNEMPPGMGLQVHRSWWVAEHAVQSASRGSRRWQLTLLSGDSVPVSDSYVSAVRERGLLKRKARG
ncbi:MAG: LytTR family DNA-binding domain-containing protein [Pseudomonadota bacterium]